MAHYLSYWKPVTVAENEGSPMLEHSASDQYAKLSLGDVLWIVSSEGPNDLVLVGRLRADHVVEQTEAERILGSTGLWEATHHAISDEPEEKMNLDISRRAHDLGFDGVVEWLPEGFTGQHLQALRRLDFDSASLLDRIWAMHTDSVESE